MTQHFDSTIQRLIITLGLSLGILLPLADIKPANAQVSAEQLSAATLEQLYAYRQQITIQLQTQQQAICPNVTEDLYYTACQLPIQLIELNLRLVNMEIGQREVLRQNGIPTS